MPLQKASLPIQFSGGLETEQDEKQVPTTRLLDLQNAVFAKKTTLVKRNGYASLSQAIEAAGMDYDDVRGFASRADEMLVFTDRNAYSYGEATGTWTDTGEVASVVVSDVPIARTGSAQWCLDTGTRNGVTAAAWEDSRGGVWGSVIDDATGRILVPATQFDALGEAPRCMECGEVVLILWVRPSTQCIYAAVVNPASPLTVPVGVILTDDLSATNPVYDAEPTLGCFDDSPPFDTLRCGVIAWVSVGGWRVAYVHPAGLLGAPSNGLPSAVSFTDAVTGPIAVSCDRMRASQVGVAWTTSGPFVTFLSSLTLAANRGPVAVGPSSASVWNHITCAFGEVVDGALATVLYWAAEIEDTRSDLHQTVIGRARDDDTTLDASGVVLRGHQLMARAFVDGPQLVSDDANDTDNAVYLAVGHAVVAFPYVAVLRLAASVVVAGEFDFPVVARLLPGQTPARHTRFTLLLGPENIRHLPSVEARDLQVGDVFARVHRIPVPIRIQLDSEDGDQFSEVGARLVTVDFEHEHAYQSAELGRGLYLASGLPLHYDGNVWTEGDYHTAPDWGFPTAGGTFDPADQFTPTTGGDMTTGSYLYKLWYEDVDGQGELHVGPTSRPILVELAPGETAVEILAPTYRLTRKGLVRLCVARSEQGATGTDESIPLYRITSTDPVEQGVSNAFEISLPTLDEVLIADTLSDADLVKREPLYTNGGILSNDPAPWSGAAIAVGKERLFWTDPSDPNVVRFSQTRREDTAAETSVALALSVDPAGGRIVGIGVQDDFVAVYKEAGIFAFAGPGPLPDPGAGSPADAFSTPEQVPSDIGCRSPASIVNTPLGQLFQSTKGIALLGRDRSVSLIGSPVAAYDDEVIRDATILPNRHQVLFLAETGRSLLFDYEHMQWSTFTNHLGLGAVVVDGVYHYLRLDGRVFRETVGVYRDDNSHITMLIKTAWIKMSAYLQGWQKVIHAMFIGKHVSDHVLRVRYALDYQVAMSAPRDIPVDDDVSGSEYGDGGYGDGPYGGAFPNSGTVYQQQIHLNKRCEAILFEISDVEATEDFGAAFELSELLLTGGILRSSFKLPATRSQ